MNEIEGTGPNSVRAEQRGTALTVAFGRPASFIRTYPTIAAIVAAAVIAVVVLIAIFAPPTGPQLGALAGIAVLNGALIAAIPKLTGQPMVADPLHRGKVEVSGTTVETSLKYDPYGVVRSKSDATDKYPQFRQSIDRDLITRVTIAKSTIAVKWGRDHEVRVQAKTGVEYVLAAHCTRQQATEIADRLRRHLELANDPWVKPRVVD